MWARDKTKTAENKRIDQYIGKQLKLARIMKDMSQNKVADHLGISFQQIQKYEKGNNRISPHRLFLLTKYLDQSINFFFPESPIAAEGHSLENSDFIELNRRSLALAAQIDQIPENIRDQLLNLIASCKKK